MVVVAFAVVSCTKESSKMRYAAKVATSQVLSVTSSSASVVGYAVASGDGIIERGVVYGTASGPTLANTKVVYTGNLTTATFTVNLTGLNFATKYFVRAYVTTPIQTTYCEEMSFTTLAILPTVTTADVTNIAGTTATAGGNVTANGGAAVTARGVCYSETANPTISGPRTTDGTGNGTFVSSLTGLKGNTTYFVRAYATNAIGTAYGEQKTFKTLIATRTWYVPGDYVTASYPGSTFANWNPAQSPTIRSVEAAPDNVEGYIFLANASNQWKLTTQPNWDLNYGSSVAGTLVANGPNIVSPAGYYKINVNAANLTYTAVPTVWGVIGSAAPGGWGSETPLTYDPASRTWRGGVKMIVGEFKFRANQNWSYNYGAATGSAKLVDGGPNIPIAVAADYYFVLDLSKPLDYTYSANRWGLIGSATPGGWGSDQPMLWDPVNKCLTITVNLVAGEIKFRANNDWALNLGGTTSALTQGGPNIPVASAGNYTIQLFLMGDGGTCTITRN